MGQANRRVVDIPSPTGSNQRARAILMRMLDDLAERIREDRIDAEDGAAVFGRLARLCSKPEAREHGASMPELRELLQSDEIRTRAPGFAAYYERRVSGRERQ